MERIDLYDEHENRVGRTIARTDPLPDGLYIMGAEVLIRHVDGSYLLLRRSQNKRAYPGYWEASAGGGAMAGEDALACIQRELWEETGIRSVRFHELAVTREPEYFCHSFLGITNCDKDAVTVQKSEVDEYKWVSQSEFIEFLNSNEVIDTQKERYREHFSRMKYLKK